MKPLQLLKAATVLAVVWSGWMLSPPTAEAAGLLDEYNVVWNSPSVDSLGSMPLGNGDVGANVWVEPNGDLLFYVSKVDAYDSAHLLKKLGRIRLRFAPALANDAFKQVLALREGAIEIKAGKVDLRVWVDANAPVIRVTGESQEAMDVAAVFETLRPVKELDDSTNRLAWGYQNTASEWIRHVQSQNTPAFAAGVNDPIMNRISGCRLSGEGFLRAGTRALKLTGGRKVDLSLRVLSSQSPALADWFDELEKPVKSDWQAHCQWWQRFWDRSHIFVAGCGEGKVNLDQCRFEQFPQGSRAYAGHGEIAAGKNAFQISQRYALERFCEAAASRGTVPPPYNGSIFTMDMPAGSLGFQGPRARPMAADNRDWAVLSFMWQNTRHPYWAMPTRGDFDTMLPGMKFVHDGLAIGRDRCQNIFHHDGAFIMEASWWNNVGVFNWERVPPHLRYHFLATIEMPAMMCDYYEHTRDKQFRDEILLPCADAAIEFYERQFPRRNAAGKMVMAPAATVETYQPVTNPNTEITALHYVLSKLLSFDPGPERAAHWARLLSELPEMPTRRVCNLDLLAVGEEYVAGREICESPELYSVYPFRQAWLGTPERLAMARQSFHVRTTSLDGTDDTQPVETGGWQAAPVQAAYLGLAREAARLVSINFNDEFIAWHGNVEPNAPFPTRPRARFPAFWETKMDGTPDNDHGANSVNALQSMLLQSDGTKIYLLPAWPEDWDVSFKLWANGNTSVECEYRRGKVCSLKVTPAGRLADVVDFSTTENRIRTLVSVAANDRNYLFGLPPMLDGLPHPGAVTAGWINRYGESITGTKGAPWPNCTIRSNLVYVHTFSGPPQIPEIPAKLVAKHWLTAQDEQPVSILRLEYDRSVEELATAAPSAGSLTQGKVGLTDPSGYPVVDFGSSQNFSRLEFSIDNPGYRRGQSRRFELQVRQTGGAWKTIFQGQVFGSIYSKTFDLSTAQVVRLKIDSTRVRRFDLF